MVKNNMDTWEIRYSKYIGDLSVFDRKIYDMRIEDLRLNQIKKDIYVTVDKLNGQLMMIEMKDANKKIAGIDKMDKKSILKIVKECIL